MAEKSKGNCPDSSGEPQPAKKVPVPLLLNELRNQVYGLQVGFKEATSSNLRKSITAMEHQIGENIDVHRKEVGELTTYHQREMARRKEEFELTINRLTKEIDDKSRLISDIEGRLTDHRKIKEEALLELEKCRDIHNARVNELEACIAEGRKQLVLLENELTTFKSESEKTLELEASLKHERSQVHRLVATIEEMEADVKDKIDTILELEKANFGLECKITVLENEKSELSEKMKRHLEMKKVENESGDSKLKVLEEQLARIQKEKSDINNMLLQEQGEKVKLQQTLSLAKVDLRIESRKIKELQAKFEERKHLFEDARKQITALEENVQASASEVESLKVEIEHLNDTIKIKAQELASIVSEKNQMADQKDKFETDNMILRNELGVLKVKVNDYGGLEKLVKDQEASIEEKNRLIAENKNQIRSLNNNVAVLKETCTTLDRQLTDFTNELKSKIGELNEAATASENMDAANVKLAKQLQQCRIELNEAKSLKAFTEKKLQSIQTSMKSETASKETEVQNMQEKLSLAVKREDDLSSQIKNYISQISQLETEKLELQKSTDCLTSTKERQTKETTQLITTLVDVKEINLHLQAALKEAISKGECYKAKLEAREEEYQQLVQSKATNDIMLNTKIQQQEKLIDHLHGELSSYQDKKKKKGLPSFTPKRTEKELHSILKTPVRTEARTQQPQLPAYYLEQKELEQLEVRKADLKSHLLSLQTNTPVSSKTPTLPIQRREENVLLKDKCNTIAGSDASSIGSFHRFEEGSCQNTQKCMVCRDPIYLGRLMAKCKQCALAFHRTCTKLASKTCGLSEKSAYEVEKSVATERHEPIADEVHDDVIKGWVKVRSENMALAEKKFLKISGSTLGIYNSEQSRHPLELFSINDNTVVYYRVDDKEDGTSSSDKYALACSLKVTFYADDEHAKPVVLFMFLRNHTQKRYWTRGIMKYTKMQYMSSMDITQASEFSLDDEDKENVPISVRDNLLLEDRTDKENKIYVNCVYWLESSNVYVLGCDDGLYSLKTIGDKPVKIRGPQSIHQIGVLAGAKGAVFIEGPDRALSTVYSGLLKTCAEAAECSEPKLTTQRVARTKSFYLFVSRSRTFKDTLVAAAGSCGLVLCSWVGDGLSVIKQMTTKESITTLLMTPYSVLYGNHSVFEVDTKTFEIEEFLDMSDPTIYLVQLLNESRGSFPVAILDVSACHPKSKETEYLICFQDIGIFVDMYGRRTRKDDILWSQAPLSFEYRRPYLFIFHFTCIEIQQIDDKSYTRVSTISRGQSRAGKEGELVAKSFSIKPITKFFSVNSKSSPKYIGNGASPHGVVFALNEARSVKVIEIAGSM